MKKAYRILAILLCLSMLFALAACSAKQENTTEDQKPDETATETTDTAEPSGDAPASEEAPEEMTLSVAWWGGSARNERIEKTLDLYSELNPNVSFSTATNTSAITIPRWQLRLRPAICRICGLCRHSCG